MASPTGVQVIGQIKTGYESVLTPPALTFLRELHRNFNYTRKSLLEQRMKRQSAIDRGEPIRYPVGNHSNDWTVASVPYDLQKRHVEITGPTDAKMIINALNSGADVFMADFEDSLCPTWSNIVEGQINLIAANKKTISFTNPNGTVRKLKDKTATLIVRTRGWHLDENHILCDGEPMAGALVDFGLYFFHNIHIRLNMGSSTYYYLPKMESHQECRLWNDIFRFSQDYLGIPQGTIRATIMIETLLAAVELEEMLYEIRDHCCGANAGRWDYIFSIIKRLKANPTAILPDRKQVTMTVSFMRAYTDRLVKVCHQHGAHAMGGMSAFIPSRRDEQVNRTAFEQVKSDKEREVQDGFDGTWVAHPDLVRVAGDVFSSRLGSADHQKHRMRDDVNVKVEQLVTIAVPGGTITEAGARVNIHAALQYINSWLQGIGAVAINNLMEDAATSEISRAQLWQWLHHHCRFDDGKTFTVEIYKKMRDEELQKLGGEKKGRLWQAVQILDKLILEREFTEFLTLPAYELLDNPKAKL